MAWNKNYNTTTSSDNGAVSMWNEGNLKSLRLHETQELINLSKRDRLTYYEDWISAIDMLYGEGQSKYSDDEIDEIERIRKLITTHILVNPPQINVSHSLLGRIVEKTITNNASWFELKQLIELFEKKVKQFNDNHGLSTRNVDNSDDGL